MDTEPTNLYFSTDFGTENDLFYFRTPEGFSMEGATICGTNSSSEALLIKDGLTFKIGGANIPNSVLVIKEQDIAGLPSAEVEVTFNEILTLTNVRPNATPIHKHLTNNIYTSEKLEPFTKDQIDAVINDLYNTVAICPLEFFKQTLKSYPIVITDAIKRVPWDKAAEFATNLMTILRATTQTLSFKLSQIESYFFAELGLYNYYLLCYLCNIDIDKYHLYMPGSNLSDDELTVDISKVIATLTKAFFSQQFSAHVNIVDLARYLNDSIKPLQFYPEIALPIAQSISPFTLLDETSGKLYIVYPHNLSRKLNERIAALTKIKPSFTENELRMFMEELLPPGETAMADFLKSKMRTITEGLYKSRF